MKKEYMKPTMKVVQLQHHAHILTGSPLKTLSGSKGEGSTPTTWQELE